jgi:hypothetical protein
MKTALGKSGLAPQITGVKGYGSPFAKYTADTPESGRVY